MRRTAMIPPRFELTIGDRDYPLQLAQAPDPPERLYGIGSPAALVPGLAVIGARRCTPYGESAATLLAGWAARSGYSVISGGALGCDQAAHRAALAEEGSTVTVLAGGADITYPAGAGTLLARVAQQGAVVSEQPWGTRPQKWMFRRRNRIIAGLSVGVLVVEAGLPSGTFSTADDALDAGREVMAVPGSIYSPESRGANRLISQGATVISDATDLRTALSRLIGEPPRESDGWTLTAEITDRLLAAVSANAMRPDDAATACRLDVVSVVRKLGALEATGRVVRYPDGRYGAAPTSAGTRTIQ